MFEKLSLKFNKKIFDKESDVSRVKTKEFNLPLVNAKDGDNGVMYYGRSEDFESAEQAFRKALTLNNKDWVTWSNLANALLKQNKLPETVSTFEKCLKLTMPASERALIIRDIADIKKILACQPKSAPKPEIVPGKGSLTRSPNDSLNQSAKAPTNRAPQTTAKKPLAPTSKVDPIKAQPKEKG